MALYQFYREQVLNASVDELWDFISSPKNLKKITPEYMGFDITSKHLPEKMYPGMMISYKVSPLPGLNQTGPLKSLMLMIKSFLLMSSAQVPIKSGITSTG